MSQDENLKERGSDDLDARQTPTLPAWKLREQMKAQGRVPSTVRKPFPIPKPRSPLEEDPHLPPAFRAAFRAQQKKGIDDFNSLASVHTASSAGRTINTANASLSDDDSSSFDGHDSFASLGDDDDDDEAYREGRNQMARQRVEVTRSPTKTIRSNDLKFKRPGVGTTLDFIAE